MPSFICSTYISHSLSHVFSVNLMWWKLSFHVRICMWHCQIHGAVFSKVFQKKHLLKAYNYSWEKLRITSSTERPKQKLGLWNSLLSWLLSEAEVSIFSWFKISVCLDFWFCLCMCSLFLSRQNLIWIPHWGGDTQ